VRAEGTVLNGVDIMNIPENCGVLVNLPVGVFAVDTDFNIRFWNRRMEIWTGLSAGEVLDKSLTELFPHIEDDLFIERLNDSIYRHIPQYFSSSLGLSIISEDITSGRPMEQRTSIVPYRGTEDNRDYALIVIEDISDLKKEVEAYRRMKDRAIMALNEQIKAEREVFEANGEANLYLEVMSHDLNNYNNVILGYASLLEHHEEPNVQKYAKGIVLAAERSFQIIQSVGTVRKLKSTASALDVVSLDNAVKEGIRHYSHVDISYVLTGAKVKAGRLLQEVFANLFGNSIRSGGMDVKIIVFVEDEGDNYLIHVDDDGPGLSDEEKDSIKYCSGEKEGVECKLKSTGLQLYIVSKLLESYGTRLTTGESSLEGETEGSRFSFSLKKG
jgi:PAS domain S-box-containing protein